MKFISKILLALLVVGGFALTSCNTNDYKLNPDLYFIALTDTSASMIQGETDSFGISFSQDGGASSSDVISIEFQSASYSGATAAPTDISSVATFALANTDNGSLTQTGNNLTFTPNAGTYSATINVTAATGGSADETLTLNFTLKKNGEVIGTFGPDNLKSQLTVTIKPIPSGVCVADLLAALNKGQESGYSLADVTIAQAASCAQIRITDVLNTSWGTSFDDHYVNLDLSSGENTTGTVVAGVYTLFTAAGADSGQTFQVYSSNNAYDTTVPSMTFDYGTPSLGYSGPYLMTFSQQ